LARAQTSRKQGQYLEAARNYQMILSRFPSSSEAAATRLSLGDLQLSQLGAPEAALNSFRQYLTAGGALRQEASYGEIRALRALGRSEEARSLARKFSASYPQSGQAVSLRRWLESPEDSRAK
jgi:tetratricopeptide (TPR) repeat protein